MDKATLFYNGETFFIDKLSSFTNLYLIKEFANFDRLICKLGFKINFSGSVMKVEREIIIPHYKWNGTYSKFLWFFKVKNIVKVSAYEKAMNGYQLFSEENYKNKFGKSYENYNKEFMKWVAEELDIVKDYDWIIEQYIFVKKSINEHFNWTNNSNLKEDKNED